MSLISWVFGRKTRKSSGFSVPDGDFRFIAIDVETANSDSASICQIGIACADRNGRIVTASTLVNPEAHFDWVNVNLHGIDEKAVRYAPTFPSVLSDLARPLSCQTVIQHSSFDRTAFRKACERAGIEMPDWHWVDSVRIAQRAWPEFKGNGGHGLAHLKTALNLKFTHHDAEEDARAAAEVVLRAENTTGLSFEALLATKSPRTQAIDLKEVAKSFSGLDQLVEYLNKKPVLGSRKREKLFDAYMKTSRKALDRGEAATVQGPPSLNFLIGEEVQVKKQLGAIANDLSAQVEIVTDSCEHYFETGMFPAPHYAKRIAIILRKAKERDREADFLEAWCRHFSEGVGVTYADLVERKRKLRK